MIHGRLLLALLLIVGAVAAIAGLFALGREGDSIRPTHIASEHGATAEDDFELAQPESVRTGSGTEGGRIAPPQSENSQPQDVLPNLRLALRLQLSQSCSRTNNATVAVSLNSRLGYGARELVRQLTFEEGGVAKATIDVSVLASAFFAPGGEMVIRANAVGCGESELRLTPIEASRDPEDSESYYLEASLALQETASVTGRIVDAQGSAVPGATVLMVDAADPKGAANILVTSLTRRDGRFSLASEIQGAVWLQASKSDVGVAERKEISLHKMSTVDVGDIRLAGQTIVGTVLASSPEIQSERLKVLLYTGGGTPFVVGSDSMTSTGGILEPYTRTTLTDSEGRFAFAGLLDHEYSVVCTGLSDACSAPGIRHPDTLVRPPGEAALTLEVPVLVLDIFGEDGPLAQATCALAVEGFSGTCHASSKGRVYWNLPPQSACTLTIASEGYIQQTLNVGRLESGQADYHAIYLERAPPQSRLTIDISLDEHGPAHYVAAGFYANEISGPPDVRNAISSNGQFSFDLNPGPYVVKIREGDWDEVSSLFTEATLEVDLHIGEQLKRQVVLLKGGRIRVRVVDPQGHLIDAECAVSGMDGILQEVMFRTLDGSTGTWHESRNHPHAGVAGSALWADVSPALRHGIYTLDVTADGWQSISKQIEVALGRITQVEIRLEREE